MADFSKHLFTRVISQVEKHNEPRPRNVEGTSSSSSSSSYVKCNDFVTHFRGEVSILPTLRLSSYYSSNPTL